MSMEDERELNPGTKYRIGESKTVILKQGDQTIILSGEDITALFVAIKGDLDDYDAMRDGCQA